VVSFCPRKGKALNCDEYRALCCQLQMLRHKGLYRILGKNVIESADTKFAIYTEMFAYLDIDIGICETRDHEHEFRGFVLLNGRDLCFSSACDQDRYE